MALITWSNEYSVGVDALDTDHIVIISLMNHVDDAKQSSAEEAVVGHLVKVLLGYAYGHFRREERLLERYGYAKLDAHLHEHRVVEEQLKELHQSYLSSGDSELIEEIMELLNFWLIEHILKVDMQYRTFLREAMG